MKTDCVQVSLSIRHSDWESMSAYKGSEWNAHQGAAEHSKRDCEGVWADGRRDVGSINSEYSQPTDEGAATVVQREEEGQRTWITDRRCLRDVDELDVD